MLSEMVFHLLLTMEKSFFARLTRILAAAFLTTDVLKFSKLSVAQPFHFHQYYPEREQLPAFFFTLFNMSVR
jgi:hypothetical protein